MAGFSGCRYIVFPVRSCLFAAASERKNRQMIDLIQKSIEAESKRLSECEGQLRQYMSGGGLSFLVEWWEKEDLLLVENAHLLFIFADGTYMDFLLHRPIAERLSSVLAEYGIKWAARMELQFDSCILYPPQCAGQPFYNPDGSIRSEYIHSARRKGT
ncbi:MAG: hypothetical protein IJE66_04215 [Akkermansia sp.]|nr:hypothetical protein [Akkermansia sp.]